MSENYDNKRLPDLVMYGGDTTPWQMTISEDIDEFGGSMEGYTAKLTFMHYAISMGLGADGVAVPPALSIEGNVEALSDSSAIAMFPFFKQDTINLHGKFVYQVEIAKENNLYVFQGLVTIKPNINRTSE